MCDRGAEEGHHGVADELLDRAAEALELGAQAQVVAGEQGADVLGVEPLRAGGEADEIAEHDGHDLPLLARRRRYGDRRFLARLRRCQDRILVEQLPV